MVLIIGQKYKNATTLSDFFYYMNIVSFPCTPSVALGEISNLYHAVLIAEPNDLPDTADFVRKLRSQASVPIFAISTNPKDCRSPYVFDKIFSNSILSGNLAVQMLMYIRGKGLREFGNYIRRGLDIRFTQRTPAYLLKNLTLTKNERLILSYLIVARHEPQHPTKILKYAFPHNRKPSIGCVRSHIYKINRKFQEQTGRRIVASNPGVGYNVIEYPIYGEFFTSSNVNK